MTKEFFKQHDFVTGTQEGVTELTMVFTKVAGTFVLQVPGA